MSRSGIDESAKRRSQAAGASGGGGGGYSLPTRVIQGRSPWKCFNFSCTISNLSGGIDQTQPG